MARKRPKNPPIGRDDRDVTLLFDLEIAQSIGKFFDYKKEYNITKILRNSYILSIAWMIKGEKTIYCRALPDFKTYKTEKHNDYELVKFIHELVSQADHIVAHNGDAFDVKFINARFVHHRLGPPKNWPYSTKDTLKLSRRITKRHSHRLDVIARDEGLGHKLPHTGQDLWDRCEDDTYDKAAWDTMKRYNKHDVFLLDAVHSLYLPWDPKPYNVNLKTRKTFACPRCGHTHLQKVGWKYTAAGAKQRFQCMKCFGYCTDKVEKLATRITIS